MSKLQELLRGWNRTFHHGEKVLILTGIHADKVGAIEAELGGPWFYNQYMVQIELFTYDWYCPWQIVSLEEIEENIPHPEYLKW